MTRQELYETLDDILELPIGTIQGSELLVDVKTWDSLAVVSFIATVNGLFGVVLSPPRVRECKSVPDLVALVAEHLTDGAG